LVLSYNLDKRAYRHNVQVTVEDLVQDVNPQPRILRKNQYCSGILRNLKRKYDFIMPATCYKLPTFNQKGDMSVKKILMTAALLLLALEVAFSETSYDLAKIVELTLKENTTIKRNSIKMNALKRKSDKRWTAMIPSLFVDGSVTRTDNSTDFINAVNASCSITLSMSAFSDIGQARLNYEAGSISGTATVREVELSVRKSFFLLLYEQEYVDYLKRTADTAKRQYELTEKNQQAGLIPRFDTLSAEVSYQNATLTLASAENSWKKNLSALKQAAGIPQAEEVRLKGSLESSLPKAELNTNGIGPESIDSALLEKNLETARFSKRMAHLNAWSPTLSCSVGMRNILQPTGMKEPRFTPNVTATISFPVHNLLPWSAANELTLAADDSIQDLELQLKAMKMTNSSKFESLLRDIHDTEKTIETRTLTVSLAEESNRLTEEAFKAGTKDFIALKSAADALEEAKTGLMKETYKLISSILDLEYLCGLPLGSLSEEK